MAPTSGDYQTNGKLALLNSIPWLEELELSNGSWDHQSLEPVSIALQDTQCLFHTAGYKNVHTQCCGSSVLNGSSPGRTVATHFLEDCWAPTNTCRCGRMVNSTRAASHSTSIGWAPTSPTVAAVSCSSAKESAESLYWLLITNVAPHWAPKSVTNYYFSLLAPQLFSSSACRFWSQGVTAVVHGF